LDAGSVGERGLSYQDDVVDYLVKGKAEHLCRENSDGNLVVDRKLLEAFRKQTETNVVWVKPDRTGAIACQRMSRAAMPADSIPPYYPPLLPKDANYN
jgi:hypothetical protein